MTISPDFPPLPPVRATQKVSEAPSPRADRYDHDARASATRNRELLPATPGEAAPARDSVELSAYARELGRLSDPASDAPVFDTVRVQAIKVALANGNYPIDHHRLAEKFLELETVLSRKLTPMAEQ